MPAVQGDARHAPGDGVDVGTVLAVDVGGTKIAAGIVDESGSLLRSAHAPTPREPDPEAVFAALTKAVGQVAPDDVRAELLARIDGWLEPASATVDR